MRIEKLMPVNEATLETLRAVSTATISMVLLKDGIRTSWLDGPKPLNPITQRIVGPAFTIRFVPGREDLSQPSSYAQKGSFRDAIEAAPAGSVVVIDARGVSATATLGDILVARLAAKGVHAAVTDAPVRDADEIRKVPDGGAQRWSGGAAEHRRACLRRLWGGNWLRQRRGVPGRYHGV